MNSPLFAIRPEPGLSATIRAGAAMGLPIIGLPLAKIAPCGWTLPDLSRIDGILIGSANAIRHAGDKLDAVKHLPLLAVGGKTAQLARSAGFELEMVGTGGLQQVVDQLDPMAQRHLLRLAGENHLALQLPRNIELTTRIVYRVEHMEITHEDAGHLRRECGILLHSAGAAQHLSQEVQRLGLDRGKITIFALGPRIAMAAGEGWADIISAANPDERSLLALAKDMCQD